ncbi:MAG: hypothetical protein AB2A00_04625 [Myxococcota bacterium]
MRRDRFFLITMWMLTTLSRGHAEDAPDRDTGASPVPVGRSTELVYDGRTTRTFPAPLATDADHLSVWAINMGWKGDVDCSTYVSDQFFRRLTQYSHAPDLVLAAEVPGCEGHCSRTTCLDEDRRASGETFAELLQAHLPGVEYAYVHAAEEPDEREPSFNMIAYRVDRFSYTEDDVLTWREAVGGDCSDSHDGEWQLTVRFRDELQGRHVVVSSVHFDHLYACAAENMERMMEEVDERWSPAEGHDRTLIVVGGDFNQKPDEDSSYPRQRREKRPDAWYREVSAAHEGELQFHDAVWLHHFDEEAESDNPICAHWTRYNTVRHRESEVDQCSYDCDDDAEESCEAHLRIDYLWVRWETPEGEVITVENTPEFDPRSWVEAARADQGYFVDMEASETTGLYSDHRAVHAILRWPSSMPFQLPRCCVDGEWRNARPRAAELRIPSVRTSP